MVRVGRRALILLLCGAFRVLFHCFNWATVRLYADGFFSFPLRLCIVVVTKHFRARIVVNDIIFLCATYFFFISLENDIKLMNRSLISLYVCAVLFAACVDMLICCFFNCIFVSVSMVSSPQRNNILIKGLITLSMHRQIVAIKI